MIKDLKNNQMKRFIGQGLEGSQVREHLSLWSWGMPLLWHVDVFTKLEVL